MMATITKFKYTLCIILLLLCGITKGQEKKSLVPGSTFPTMKFPVKNFPKDSIDLSDYKDKLVIIDIWDVTCSGCITAMPKMQKLQEKYKDQIKIILLSNDSWAAIEKLKLRSEILQNIKLPMIIGDSNLESLINYTYLPTYVWVKDGKTILNITDSENFSENKIKEFLTSGNLKVQNKKEIDTKTNTGPLLTTLYPYINEDFEFYSFLWKQGHYLTHTRITISRNDKNRNLIERVLIAGNNIRTLYQSAYDNNFKHKSFRRIIFDDPNIEKTDTAEYSFEMIFGKARRDDAVFELMRNQLDLNLGLTSKVETRLQDVYVLKRIKDIPLTMLTSEKKNITRAIGTSDSSTILAFKNTIWVYVQSSLISQGEIVPPYEMIDETGIDIETPVSFEMPQDLSLKNLGAVNKKLKEVGLEIEFTKRPLEVVVIYKQ